MPSKVIRPLLLICVLSTSVWAASIFDIAINVLQGWGRHIAGIPSTNELTLPQQLTDANWGLKRIKCEAGGYDLTPYAGGAVSAVTYGIAETWYGEPLNAWVLIKENTCICAYITVRQESNAAPGVFAINDPTITYTFQTVTVPAMTGWGVMLLVIMAGAAAVSILHKQKRAV